MRDYMAARDLKRWACPGGRLHTSEADWPRQHVDLANQPARGLLSCANNLLFCAEIISAQRTDRKRRRTTDGGLVRASRPMRIHLMPKRRRRDRSPGVCTIARVR